MPAASSSKIDWKRSLRGVGRKVPLVWDAYRLYWDARARLEMRRRYAMVDALLPFTREGVEPTLERTTSQLCTARQCREPAYLKWCASIDSPPRIARKQWEFVFILEVLRQAGMLMQGKKGLGFGCGSEPLPAVMAKHGCSVVATDLDLKRAAERGWTRTHQHAAGLESLFDRKWCDRELFLNKVSFQIADMNRIPEDFSGFDFVWSACALEHLGSLRHGMEFVRNAMRCLRSGGVAVHTTEFNLSSENDTFEDQNCVIYRRRDMLKLAQELEAEGNTVRPLNLNAGALPVDRYIDAPPYAMSPHIKIRLAGHVATSIGLIIEKR